MVNLTSLIHNLKGVWTLASFFVYGFLYTVHQRGTHLYRLFYRCVRFVTLSRESRKSETNWKIELANRTQQVSFDLLIHIWFTVIEFNYVRRSNALNKSDLLGYQGSSCCITLLTANSKLPNPYLNNNQKVGFL